MGVGGSSDTSDLLQALIRNECVNDGSAASGHEIRNAETLRDYLGMVADVEVYEPAPGRGSIVGRIEGTDPAAPTACFLGHLDVVPAHGEAWQHDPFGGEIDGGWLWGRGAVDMLNLTSAMAVAFKSLAVEVRRGSIRPRGTLVFVGAADVEANGIYGTDWLLENATDNVRADFVITESGGVVLDRDGERFLTVGVAEKGGAACTLRVSGTAGHGSAPFRTDNALVNAARVVERLSEWTGPAVIDPTWSSFVRVTESDEVARFLLDDVLLNEWCRETDDAQFAREVHACTHLTIAPTVMRTGVKVNVIPDLVELDLDIRTLPGQDQKDIEATLREVLGALADRVEIVIGDHDAASRSSSDTSFYRVLEGVGKRYYPGAQLLAMITTGATDARFYRWRGASAYGFGLFSELMSLRMYRSMFHATDERVDLGSLALTTSCFEDVGREVVADRL